MLNLQRFGVGQPMEQEAVLTIDSPLPVSSNSLVVCKNCPPMPRPLRIEFAGTIYHLMNRASELLSPNSEAGARDSSSGILPE
jgi:hypothetical protein